jgi:predicted nucleic acid-binding protein
MSPRRAEEALADFTDLDLHRHPHLDPWVARGSCDTTSPHTTPCVALAEALEAPIVTCDSPLAKAPRHRARIEVVA